MNFDFSALNFLAILVCIIVGQIIATLWYTVLFGDAWSREYGAASKKEHTKAIPAYTYAIGLLCTTTLTLGIALLHQALSIQGLAAGLQWGFLIAIGFSSATSLPGLAFLKKWRVFLIPAGCQSLIILAVSSLLAAWP